MATASQTVLREYLQVLLSEGAWETAIERSWERDDLVHLFQVLKGRGVSPKFIPVLSKTSNVLATWSPGTWEGILTSWEEIAKKNLPGFEKDVTKYQDGFALADAVESYKDKVSKSQEKKTVKSSGTKQIYQDEDWTVIRVDSKEASCEYGRNTKWCISATEDDNHFTSYHQDSSANFYFVMSRKSGEKFAIAVYPQEIQGKTRDYYDAEDNELSEGEFRNRLVDLGASDDLLKVLGLQTRDLLKPSPGQLQNRGDQMLADPISWVLNPSTDLDSVKLNLLVKVLPALEKAAKTNPEVRKKLFNHPIVPVLQAGDNVLAGLSTLELEVYRSFLGYYRGNYRYPYLIRTVEFLMDLKDSERSVSDLLMDPKNPRKDPMVVSGMIREDPGVLRRFLREVLYSQDLLPPVQMSVVEACLASPGFRDSKKFYKETIGPDLLRGLSGRFPWVTRILARVVKDSMTTSALDTLVDRIFDLQGTGNQTASAEEMEAVWNVLSTYSDPDDPRAASRQIYDELGGVGDHGDFTLGLAIRPYLGGGFDTHQVLAVLTQIRAHGWDAGKWVVDQVLQ